MKLIESKAEYIPQKPDLEGAYELIEKAGRTCYKSEDKITLDSAKKFFDRMHDSKHFSMLEHGTIYFNIFPEDDFGEDCIDILSGNPYTKCFKILQDKIGYAITTNLRVIIECSAFPALSYICKPTKYHEKRYTMKFICDRGVSHELVRHRAFSFAQESTRYCNYSKDKFGNELTFIKPSWYNGSLINSNTNIKLEDGLHSWSNSNYIHILGKDIPSKWFLKNCLEAEYCYLHMINDLDSKLTPQQARQVLPNALKTEIIMTGFASDWKHFFDLRLFGKTGAPHPDMKLLAEKAQKAIQDAGIWEDIMSDKSKFK